MENEQSKFMWFEKNIMPLVYKQLKKLTNKGLYYEVFCDLEDGDFLRFYNHAKKYPNLASYNIARWAIARDKWYWSPSYVKSLNDAMKKTDNPSEAFSIVLNNKN